MTRSGPSSAGQTKPATTTWQRWWIGIRPQTLTMAIVPVLVGTLLAWSDGFALQLLPMCAALAGALLIQAGTNLFNDVRDAQRGTDTKARIGPTRLTSSGLATPHQVGRMALIAFALAFGCGLYLVAVAGWPIVVIGSSALLAGWAYSSGPWPLSHTPWGEVFVLVYFGIVAVTGSHYVQSATLTLAPVVVGCAVGLPAAAVLLLNNVRDLETDIRAGRRTLAAVVGKPGASAFYAGFMLLPFALLYFLPDQALPGLSWLALPLFGWLIWRFHHARPGPAMNTLLVRTAQSQVLLGLLISANLLAGNPP